MNDEDARRGRHLLQASGAGAALASGQLVRVTCASRTSGVAGSVRGVTRTVTCAAPTAAASARISPSSSGKRAGVDYPLIVWLKRIQAVQATDELVQRPIVIGGCTGNGKNSQLVCSSPGRYRPGKGCSTRGSSSVEPAGSSIRRPPFENHLAVSLL